MINENITVNVYIVQFNSNIVQLDFSAAFDSVSHSGLLFKLKSIGVSGRGCRSVESSSSVAGKESEMMVLPVSGS